MIVYCTGYIIIIMKGQILSRIQSYQNIPVNNVMNTSKNTKDKNEQLIN
jgi:hypothetical protein